MASGLEGTRELEAKLRALGEAVAAPILRKAVRKAIKPAFQKAQELIPVGVDAHRTYKGRLVAPGFARRSIRTVTRVSDDKQRVSAALGVRKEAFYAVLFTELGTSKMAAHPWLRPALQTTQGEQEQILAEEIRAGIEKVAKS